MNTDIRKLIDKYFEGETTTGEDEVLRDFFANEDVPHDLKILAPLFNFMNDESSALRVLREVKDEEKNRAKRKSLLQKNIRYITSIAAVMLIAIVLVIQNGKDKSVDTENYVWVDGNKITDIETVQKYAEISFGNIETDRDLIDEQLSFMLD